MKSLKHYITQVTESREGVAEGSLMEDPVTAFASKAHDEWRQGWIKQNSGKSVPRIKKNSDGSEGDINVPFGKLHPDWQRENLAAGRAAMQAVKQFPNDIEKASEFIHNEWMKRNPKADYNAAQHVPYDQLPEPEKEKDRVHVRTMMQLMGKQSVAEALSEPKITHGPDTPYEVKPGEDFSVVFKHGKQSGAHYHMNSGYLADPFYFKLNGKLYSVSNQGDGIPKEVQQGVSEDFNGISASVEPELDYDVVTVTMDGKQHSFNYWHAEEPAKDELSLRKDMPEYLNREQWYANLDHPTKMEVLHAVVQAVLGNDASEYKPSVGPEPMNVGDELDESIQEIARLAGIRK